MKHRSILLFVSIVALLILSNTLTAFADEDYTEYTIGHYTYTLPSEWTFEPSESKDEFHYHYETGNPFNGAYLMAQSLKIDFDFNISSAESELNTFINAFIEALGSKEYVEIDTLSCQAASEYPSKAIRCTYIYPDGLKFDFSAYMWIEQGAIYVFTYSDPTDTPYMTQKSLGKILETVTDISAEEAPSEEASETEAPADYININSRYFEYARDPDGHKNDLIEFSGKVIQVIEGGSTTQYRVAVGGDSDSVFLVEYARPEGELRILKDDLVTVRGVSRGIVTYQSTAGGQITVPYCIASQILQDEPLFVAVTGNQDQDAQDQFPVVAYRRDSGNDYDLYLVITNNSGKNAKLDVSIRYFDENGGIVGISNASANAFTAGTQTLITASNDIAFATYEYEITAKDETYYACVTGDLEIETTIVGDKAIVGVTNNGPIAAQFVEYNILFLKDNEVVYTSWGYVNDSDYEIKPNKTQYFEQVSRQPFDEVLVFLDAYGDK